MAQTYQEFCNRLIPQINQVLTSELVKVQAPTELITAMKYSVDAGGKRLRPIMTLVTYEAFGGKITDEIIKVACAVELVHTYSLIHDDLPAMDNDTFRRGKLTNHKVFGEAQAILAGDGLLTLAFSWLTDNNLPTLTKLTLVQKLAESAGPSGMVGGQVNDMLGNNRTYTHEQLIRVHNLKTGALLSYAALAGGVLAQKSPDVIKMLTQFGLKYGLAFQIQDDLLDVDDAVDFKKNTYPHLMGIVGAQVELVNLIEEIENLLGNVSRMVECDQNLIEGLLTYFERNEN